MTEKCKWERQSISTRVPDSEASIPGTRLDGVMFLTGVLGIRLRNDIGRSDTRASNRRIRDC